MNTITAALAASAISAPIAAAGTMSYIADQRQLITFGANTSTSGQVSSEVEQQHPDAPYADWNTAIAAGVSSALGFATIDSTLSETSIDAVGFASGGGLLPADSFASISALGASIHTISFDISQTTTFSLDANLRASGIGESFIRLTNAPLGGGDTIYQFLNTDNNIDIQEQITLNAGQYTLTFHAHSGGRLDAPGQIEGSARYDAAWTIVPAPPTALLPLLGLAATHRRRAAQ
ncbi:MAG: hypothetical protein ACF8LL_04435 [Phycisphaerales bacterium]